MSKDTAASLSAKEMELLAAAWMSCATPPKPDYKTVAEICGYKNAATATVMFNSLKRKLIKAGGGEVTTRVRTPAKKRANDEDGDTPAPTKKRTSDDADNASEQPKKRGRKPKVELTEESKIKEEPGVEDSEQDLLAVDNFGQLTPVMDRYDDGLDLSDLA